MESETSQSDILVHLRRTDAQTPAASAGLALGRRLNGWVTGLHVVPIAAAAFASPEAVAMVVPETDSLYREALAFESGWRAALEANGLGGEWQVSQGETIEAICHASRWCDLVVLERPQLNPDAPVGWGLVSRTVFGSAAPVVVVPEAARCDSVGERIVVAWNESREAMLAIRGALPLLARAASVTVLVGEPVENPFGLRWLPRLDLAAWLARRGIKAAFRPLDTGREKNGPALLSAARAADADLIVMGAWGHSRITELVLGGTTRHLFQFSDLPLLVAH
jgi:nucleotide-binding universal stress UspA family protein